MTAVMRLNTSCIARGFFKNGVCGGNGDPCTECSRRARDRLEAAPVRPSPRPALGAGAEPDRARQLRRGVVPPTPFNSGPCQRGTHCEGTIIGEAVWDLLKRDLPCHTRRWENSRGRARGGRPLQRGRAHDHRREHGPVLGTRLFYSPAKA